MLFDRFICRLHIRGILTSIFKFSGFDTARLKMLLNVAFCLLFLRTSNTVCMISIYLVKSKPGSCNLRDIGKVKDNISTATSKAKINSKVNIE